MSRRLVIFGLGKIGEVAFNCWRACPEVEVAAFCCDGAYKDRDEWFSRPVVAFEDLRAYPPSTHELFIAVGYHGLNSLRAERCLQAKQRGYQLATYVSPAAHLAQGVAVGENCLVLDGVSIQPGAAVGDDVFLWSGAVVGHHSRIGNHCWLASGTLIGGDATVGEACFTGLGAVVGHGVTVGAKCFLGARSVVLQNAPEKSVFIERGTERYRLDSERFMQITKFS